MKRILLLTAILLIGCTMSKRGSNWSEQSRNLLDARRYHEAMRALPDDLKEWEEYTRRTGETAEGAAGYLYATTMSAVAANGDKEWGEIFDDPQIPYAYKARLIMEILESRLGRGSAWSYENGPIIVPQSRRLDSWKEVEEVLAQARQPRKRSKISEDEKIWDIVVRRRGMFTRVTQKPFHVVWQGRTLCARPNRIPHSPHGEHWIHVYVSPEGTNTITTGKGSYPFGTIILKQKFFDAEGKRTDFYTGMRKRESGYNPRAGDWEFFTLNKSARMVTARGKIESCMGCHQAYEETDYVSRRYLRADGWD